jgi:hypothetical protein
VERSRLRMIDLAVTAHYTDSVNFDPLIGWIEFHRKVRGLFRTCPRINALDSSKIIGKACTLEIDLGLMQILSVSYR